MQNEALQWIVGGAVVIIYAARRFESPAPARATTTFARYWLAKFCYGFAMLLLFTFLGGSLAQVPGILQLLTAGMDVPASAKELPGPLLAALLLTTLLPNTPILSTADEFVRDQFRRLGNIPFQVVQLSARLQQVDYRVPPALRAAAYEEIREIRASPRRQDAQWQRWLQVAGVHVTLANLPAHARYAEYMLARKPAIDGLAARYADLKASLLDEPGLLDDNQEAEPASVRRMRAQFRTQLAALRTELYDLLAGAILACERNGSGRDLRLQELGFARMGELRTPLSFHEVVAVAGIVFIAMNAGVLLARWFVPGTNPNNALVIAVMVSIIYAVALVAAVYPKGMWRFFDIGATGRRPIAAYLASALTAAVLALFISITFRYLFLSPGDFVRALADTQYRWPWLLMTMGVTFSIAWACDNHYGSGAVAPRWLRYAEAAGMAVLFVALQAYVQVLLESVALDPLREHERQMWRLFSAGTIGLCIGALVPSMYRASRARPLAGAPAGMPNDSPTGPAPITGIAAGR